MSEKKLEECSLEEATHIEMGGKVYKFGKEYTIEQDVLKYNDCHIDVCRGTTGWQLIHVDTFPLLGIKPLKEIKPEPIEFEATFFKHDGKWRTLYLGDNHLPYENSKKARFRCVEILEEEE